MKDFDVNSPTNGLSSAEGTELAGVSDKPKEDERDPEKAVEIFPVSWDKGSRVKDFRPQETINSELVPKDASALASASQGRLSSTSQVGLEDVSPDDLELTNALTPAETAF